MNVEPTPSPDEAAAIIVAIATLTAQRRERTAGRTQPHGGDAWRIAGRMPWHSNDDIRAMMASKRKS